MFSKEVISKHMRLLYFSHMRSPRLTRVLDEFPLGLKRLFYLSFYRGCRLSVKLCPAIISLICSLLEIVDFNYCQKPSTDGIFFVRYFKCFFETGWIKRDIIDLTMMHLIGSLSFLMNLLASARVFSRRHLQVRFKADCPPVRDCFVDTEP